jgi:hypothetical protein
MMDLLETRCLNVVCQHHLSGPSLAEAERCQGWPQATAKPLGLDRRSAAGAQRNAEEVVSLIEIQHEEVMSNG